MLEVYKSLSSVLNKVLPPFGVLLTLLILGWVLGYAPQEITAPLKIAEMPTSVISTARIVFIICCAAIAVKLSITILNAIWRAVVKLCKLINVKRFKLEDLTDEELALVFLFKTYVGGTVRVAYRSAGVQALSDKGLITNFNGVFFVTDSSPYQDYWLTESGKNFAEKNNKKLHSKFSDNAKFLSYVEEYVEGSLTVKHPKIY